MDDEDLRRGVVRLYAFDEGLGRTSTAVGRRLGRDAGDLRTRCADAIWDRLMGGEVDLRVWLSRLVRDVFLSESALERGLGIEDACDFWSWFDATMWREAVLRAPDRPRLRSVPAPDPGAAPAPPAGDAPPAVPRPVLLGRAAGSTR